MYVFKTPLVKYRSCTCVLSGICRVKFPVKSIYICFFKVPAFDGFSLHLLEKVCKYGDDTVAHNYGGPQQQYTNIYYITAFYILVHKHIH